MASGITGLHHVTAIAGDPVETDAFWRSLLGLRRVKTTVNFDAPYVYHLYFAAGEAAPGTLLTHFPNDKAPRRTRGTREVGETALSVPEGQLGFWAERLRTAGARNLREATRFGETRLEALGPDGAELALVAGPDSRPPTFGSSVPDSAAIRGLHSVTLRLREAAPTIELLGLLGLQEAGAEGNRRRFTWGSGGAGKVIDVEEHETMARAQEGAGSVHHIAFEVEDRAAQDAWREKLRGAGLKVTHAIDRSYFWSIYFRTPSGILFEIATRGPGFYTDESPEELGRHLQLPEQHEHRRAELVEKLPPLPDPQPG